MPIIRLVPLGSEVSVASGAGLADVLFPLGVEFPCGGEGTCGGCRVRVLAGSLEVTSAMEGVLRQDELEQGWRLACCARVEADVTLEVDQWNAPILGDDAVCAVEPRPGRALAVDIGTTTIASQLLDLETGAILGVRTGLNPQAVLGSDVMTRVEAAVTKPGAALRLMTLIRDAVAGMAGELGSAAEIWLSGNTVMHHLFCGLDVEPLSHAPFETPSLAAWSGSAADLGWRSEAKVVFLGGLGSFVGSDILAGIVASGMAEREAVTALLDLGTNGEIVVGNRDRLLCASTAAGPAFEAGRIAMGMRAAEGAISHVTHRAGTIECRVLGGGAPRGICGSGLVSAAACALDLGILTSRGRFHNGSREWPLAEPVRLTQADIRQLQLAKGAIAAGLRLLCRRWGTAPADLAAVYLAGAFGNYVEVPDARRIGLVEVDAARVHPVGNSALRGTKLIALNPSCRERWLETLPSIVTHIPLHADPDFQETFVDCMSFPN